MNPLTLITNLRNSDEYIEHLFTKGSCYKFHVFLKSIYHDGKPYISHDQNHIVTRIGDFFFDINGLQHEHKFRPLKDSEIEMVEAWSFRNHHLLKLEECPNCDEPLSYNQNQ